MFVKKLVAYKAYWRIILKMNYGKKSNILYEFMQGNN